jgi:hypothetical protein
MRNNSESNSLTHVASGKSVTCVLIDNAGRHNGSRTPDVRCCRQSLVTRRHRPAWMIVCVRWQSGSRRPSMVFTHLQNCTWRTSPFDAGQEDAELVHLKEHLSWRVQRGHATCAGCWQTRGEDTPLRTCSGCSVARFCSADHKKMASKKPDWAGF